MKLYNLVETFSLIIGVILGSSIFICLYVLNKSTTNDIKDFNIIQNETSSLNNVGCKLYSTTLADKLFDEVKILCLVITYPKNHYYAAIQVKKTWGNKCNKLIFLSTADDGYLEAINVPVKEGYEYIWGKVKYGFQLAYNEYFDEFDWFLKADDDSYFAIENLRHLLYQYHTQTSIIIGHKFAVEWLKYGYLAGGGYVLSKKALERFIQQIDNEKCREGDVGSEDLQIGGCMQQKALFIDAHDTNHEKQFFPLGFEEHFKMDINDVDWYFNSQWAHFIQGNLSCCSEQLVGMHYVSVLDMYTFNYLLYNVHPFGLSRKYNSELPRKLTFDEIVKAADEKSTSPNFREHEVAHHFDNDEIF